MKILGSCVVKVDGQTYLTVPDSVELGIGGYNRTVETADNSIHYRNGPLVASSLGCEFLHSANTDLKKLNDLVEGLVEIITDVGNGITYTIPNATRTGDPISTSSSNGRIRFQCNGDPVPGL
jgi:hypothetical protein